MSKEKFDIILSLVMSIILELKEGCLTSLILEHRIF